MFAERRARPERQAPWAVAHSRLKMPKTTSSVHSPLDQQLWTKWASPPNADPAQQRQGRLDMRASTEPNTRCLPRSPKSVAQERPERYRAEPAPLMRRRQRDPDLDLPGDGRGHVDTAIDRSAHPYRGASIPTWNHLPGVTGSSPRGRGLTSGPRRPKPAPSSGSARPPGPLPTPPPRRTGPCGAIRRAGR